MLIFVNIKINQEGHTCSPLPDLLRHDPKDRDYLDHDLYDDVRHSHRRSDMNVFFQTDEKELHAAKQVYKSILAGADILDGLSGICDNDKGTRVELKKLT